MKSVLWGFLGHTACGLLFHCTPWTQAALSSKFRTPRAPSSPHARPKAKAREEAHSPVRVVPLSGTIAPYGSARLLVTFHPPAAARSKGFGAQQVEAEEAARGYDYVVQVGPRKL